MFRCLTAENGVDPPRVGVFLPNGERDDLELAIFNGDGRSHERSDSICRGEEIPGRHTRDRWRVFVTAGEQNR